MLIVLPSYSSLSLKEHSDVTPEFLYILQAFTEYHAGIYEQAFLSYFKAGLNKTHVTKFNFLNWQPGVYKNSGVISYLDLPNTKIYLIS